MVTTQSMIERVARAICLAAGLDPDRKFKSSDYGPETAPHEYAWHEFLPEARAAIEAMREPTPDMISAGIKREVAWEYGNRGDWDDESGPHVPSHAAYQSMIDAAINEQVSG